MSKQTARKRKLKRLNRPPHHVLAAARKKQARKRLRLARIEHLAMIEEYNKAMDVEINTDDYDKAVEKVTAEQEIPS